MSWWRVTVTSEQAIVVGTGIYTLYRESRPGRARHAARRPAAASRPAPGA